MRAAPTPVRRGPRLLPESRAGWWAVALQLLAVGSFLLLVGIALADDRFGELFRDHPSLALPALVAGICTSAAGVAGGYAIVRRGERGGLVVLATALGLILVAFALGETFAIR